MSRLPRIIIVDALNRDTDMGRELHLGQIDGDEELL
jgi:hypothetical protein